MSVSKSEKEIAEIEKTLLDSKKENIVICSCAYHFLFD